MSDLEQLSMGMVIDIFIESGNDSYDYGTKANQADFDKY